VSTPNAPHPALTPRERFLRERQQRQNTTFSIIGVAMIAAAVLAALVFTGLLPIPFGNGFSEKIKYAEVGDVPCPIQSAKPVPPSQVSVTVINTTQHAGLASKASDMLATAGFQMQEPGNAEVEYTGKVRITAGASAVPLLPGRARASQRRDGLVSQGRTRHLLRRGDERRGRSARLEVLRFR